MSELAVFAAIGFLSQLVDGALGMAYGVLCNTLLLTFGYSPAAASASIHVAEILTSGVSGHFHWKLGNVDRQLFRNLVWPGAIGAVLGALVISSVPGDRVRPWVATYLAAMGLRILYRIKRVATMANPTSHRVEVLGFVGGALDAIGGGGWGPVVTTTLVGRGHEPRMAIGSVNRAEFFVTLAASFTFVFTIGVGDWTVIAALAIGGALAAPFSAHLARRIRPEWLMAIVGVTILALSLRTIVVALR